MHGSTASERRRIGQRVRACFRNSRRNSRRRSGDNGGSERNAKRYGHRDVDGRTFYDGDARHQPEPHDPAEPTAKGFPRLKRHLGRVEQREARHGHATVNPNVLTGVATGAIEGIYEYALTGTVFNGAYAFEAPIKITVELAYYVIKSKLDVTILCRCFDTARRPLVTAAEASAICRSQLWAFEPDPAGSVYYYIVSKLNGNVVDIERASKDAGAFLDAFPRKVADDGHSGSDNQLWYFVIDPLNSGTAVSLAN